MPQGAPHVTPQDDRPLIQISLHIKKGPFKLQWPTLNVEGPHKRRYEMGFFLTFHSISSKQKTLDSQLVSLALAHLGRFQSVQTGEQTAKPRDRLSKHWPHVSSATESDYFMNSPKSSHIGSNEMWKTHIPLIFISPKPTGQSVLLERQIHLGFEDTCPGAYSHPHTG